MKASRTSYTAEVSAAIRAAESHEETPNVKTPDILAARLLSRRFRLVVRSKVLRNLSTAYLESQCPGLYDEHLARSQYYDAFIQRAIRRGDDQFLLLGAGLDTRAYRLFAPQGAWRVFEVDHPASSSAKRERLRRSRLAAPHVRFVEADFRHDDLAGALEDAGFNRECRSVVTWEGVTMYLDLAAIDRVLRAVASLPRGSRLAFDYLSKEAVESSRAAGQSHAARRGEPYSFGIDPDQLEPFLARRGFVVVEALRSDQLVRRHLGHHGRTVASGYGVVEAKVA